MGRRLLRGVVVGVLLGVVAAGYGQQVVQRGAMGRPSEVMDDTGQWTAPLVVADDHEVELMIPDVSSPVWLKKNYRDFIDKHQYVVTMFTFYKSPEACKANQIGWGNSDAASLDACTLDIGYRMRQAQVDTHLKTVTLLEAAMVGHDGEIVPSTKIEPRMDRTWASLDANSQAALEKTTRIVSKQMKAYDLKVQSLH